MLNMCKSRAYRDVDQYSFVVKPLFFMTVEQGIASKKFPLNGIKGCSRPIDRFTLKYCMADNSINQTAIIVNSMSFAFNQSVVTLIAVLSPILSGSNRESFVPLHLSATYFTCQNKRAHNMQTIWHEHLRVWDTVFYVHLDECILPDEKYSSSIPTWLNMSSLLRFLYLQATTK